VALGSWLLAREEESLRLILLLMLFFRNRLALRSQGFVQKD
jgi:hypothetical protein